MAACGGWWRHDDERVSQAAPLAPTIWTSVCAACCCVSPACQHAEHGCCTARDRPGDPLDHRHVQVAEHADQAWTWQEGGGSEWREYVRKDHFRQFAADYVATT